MEHCVLYGGTYSVPEAHLTCLFPANRQWAETRRETGLSGKAKMESLKWGPTPRHDQAAIDRFDAEPMAFVDGTRPENHPSDRLIFTACMGSSARETSSVGDSDAEDSHVHVHVSRRGLLGTLLRR